MNSLKFDQEWDYFLDVMQQRALADYHATQEYAYWKQRRESIELCFECDQTSEQKEYTDELLLEISLEAERESNLLYRRGFRDCIELLKTLQVLA